MNDQLIMRTNVNGKMLEMLVNKRAMVELLRMIATHVPPSIKSEIKGDIESGSVELTRKFMPSAHVVLSNLLDVTSNNNVESFTACYMLGHICSLALVNDENIWIVDDADLSNTTSYGPGHYFVGDVIHYCKLDIAHLGAGEHTLDDGSVVRLYKVSDINFVPERGCVVLSDADENSFFIHSGYIGIVRCDYIDPEVLLELYQLEFEQDSDPELSDVEAAGFSFVHSFVGFKVKDTLITVDPDHDVETYVFDDICIDHTFHHKAR